MLEISNLTKTFKTKDGIFTALDNINLTIKDGEIFGIIGLSGGGKSTLVRCINLLEKPDEGSIILDGEDLTKKSKKELNKARKKMSMIFQGFNLFEQRTALDNVCFPMRLEKIKKDEAKEIALELINQVGLKDKANNYPSQLSGGQKQRISIARALASNPNYLLCDEATSALDPEATESVLSILKKINKEKNITVVVITHELNVITKICNRVAVIEDGKICECKETNELFTNPESDAAKRLIRAASFDKLDD